MSSQEQSGNEFSYFEGPVPTGGMIIVGHQGDRLLSTLIDESCRSVDPQSLIASSTDTVESSADALILEELGIAVIAHNDQSATAAIMNALSQHEIIEDTIPEFYEFALGSQPVQQASFVDNSQFTWGLQAIGADTTAYDGAGIRVAVLDTGYNQHHIDLVQQVTSSRSFIAGESVHDLNGHGSHCAGTVAGPRAQGGRPGYGVAPNADLLIAKVLSDAGSGSQGGILQAMVWAANSGADIISMSLGAATRVGQLYHPAYERAAKYALQQGALVIAAAGNESRRRFGYVAPVGSPANCPSIMAVAALDQSLEAADFSCGERNPDGGEINVSAPGVDVFSSYSDPRKYRAISGTSMACPHVAGVAALHAQATGSRGMDLWQVVENSVQGLPHAQTDVGKGLVRVP